MYLQYAGLVLTVWLLCTSAAGATLDEARAMHSAGDLNGALDAYRDVIENADDAGERGVAHNNTCVILTNRGALSDALAACTEAIRLRNLNGTPRARSRTLNNLGRVYERLGEFEQARTAHRAALRINEQQDDVEGQVINHLNLGVVETQSDNLAAALRHNVRASKLIDAHPDSAWHGYQATLAKLNTAVVHERIGAYRKALELLDAARENAREHAPSLLTDIQLNRGVVLRNLGDPVAALKAYNAALPLFLERDDHAAVANVYLNLARVHWQHLGNSVLATNLLTRAAQLGDELGEDHVVNQAEYFLARIKIATDPRMRLPSQFSADGLLDANYFDRKDPADWRTHDITARSAFARREFTRAIDAAQVALNIIEAQRARLDLDIDRQRLLADRREVYDVAVDILFEMYRETPSNDTALRALQIAGRAKALALVEATGRASGSSDLDTASLLAGVASEQALEMFQTQNRIYVWHVFDGRVTWRYEDAEVINAYARTMHNALRRGVAPPEAARIGLSTLTRDVAQATPPIIIAPDGLLNAIPFVALPSATEHMPAIRYAATLATALEPGGAAAPTKTPRISAFARSAPAHGITDHPALSQLKTLTFVASEVAAVARRLGGNADVFIDEQATETRLRELANTPVDVLHIASHAVLDARLADGAVLVLGEGADHDGLLFPRDVASLSLAPKLTVLSACSTALGEGTTGSVVTNLTGAFLAAGSSAVLATLWDVDDESSARFMDSFYRQIAKGRSPRDALHETQREHFRSDRAPTAWDSAAYVLYGDSPPLKTSQPTFVRSVAIVTAGLLFASSLWFLRRRR